MSEIGPRATHQCLGIFVPVCPCCSDRRLRERGRKYPTGKYSTPPFLQQTSIRDKQQQSAREGDKMGLNAVSLTGATASTSSTPTPHQRQCRQGIVRKLEGQEKKLHVLAPCIPDLHRSYQRRQVHMTTELLFRWNG